MAKTLVDEKINGPMTVTFKTGLRTDGEITFLYIEQFESRIQLTKAQCISLARMIKTKFGDL